MNHSLGAKVLTDPEGHLPALDGVRGLAALLVLLFHSVLYCPRATSTYGERLWYLTASFGWSGVDLFFVLSGFLITGILLATRGTENFFRNFYVRRALRILPLFYGSLVCFFFVFRFITKETNGFDWLYQRQAWFWTYTQNWVFVDDQWPAPNLLVHFWSLAVEEQFYLFWPLVVFLVPSRMLKRVCVGCIVVSVLVRLGVTFCHLSVPALHFRAYFATPARLDGLCLGGLMAILWREGGGNFPTRLVRRSLLVAAFGLVLYIVLFFTSGRWLREIFQYTLVAVFFAGVIIAALCVPRTRALFSWAPLRLVGKVSYGIYVYHAAIMIPLSLVWQKWHWGPFSWPLVRQLAFLVATFTLTLSAAWLSWHLYEKRFVRLKHRFATSAPPPPKSDELSPAQHATPSDWLHAR